MKLELCQECGRNFYSGKPVSICDDHFLLSEAASEAKPPQAVTVSASFCPSARAPGDKEADTSSHCPDSSGSAEDAAPYWLLRALAEHVAAQDFQCNRQPCSCDQSSDCITEWCVHCAARAWLEGEKLKERPLPTLPLVGSERSRGTVN